MKGLTHATPFVFILVLAVSLPTARAEGWSEEFANWRDCVVDGALQPPPSACPGEFVGFVTAIRKHPLPFCMIIHRENLLSDPAALIEFIPCD